ncbi:TRAP transporter substrate-binding protein [uncultured Ferrovibrio sp.]|mgnify:CR=1 FL=1|jgi:TRAP-type C4-dicarboxylate transport system substrate-binding protein|uniref:TRAP transporter substrate-binding protein n=1 Tax=uncultured Ferrovibrio sp. TaxID=1576913 RepID=UPI00260465B4|nr:TRAP transporter substrate-binding protein [uncultured Ferrovibrio sp.]
MAHQKSALTRHVFAGAAALAVAATLSVAAPSQSVAQDKTVTLRLAHWLPPAHPLHPSWQEWGKSLEAATNGTVKLQIFPAQQLGAAKDHYDMARDGVADLTYVNPGYTPGRFPIIAGSELPFLFSNGKSGSAAIDAWYRKYAEKEMADVKVCMTFVHDPGTFHSKVKIAKPDDVKGLKIRPGNATVARLVTLAGGTNVQVTAPEARDALERGVADALTFPWDSIFIFGIDKAVKYHTDVPLYISNFVLAMNKGAYAKLSPAQQKAVDEHCTSEWSEKVNTRWSDAEASGKAKMLALPGHEAVKPSADDMAAWQKIADEMTKAWYEDVKKVGVDGKTALDELKAELKKRNAAAS